VTDLYTQFKCGYSNDGTHFPFEENDIEALLNPTGFLGMKRKGPVVSAAPFTLTKVAKEFLQMPPSTEDELSVKELLVAKIGKMGFIRQTPLSSAK
jgi:hypothetical protein